MRVTRRLRVMTRPDRWGVLPSRVAAILGGSRPGLGSRGAVCLWRASRAAAPSTAISERSRGAISGRSQGDLGAISGSDLGAILERSRSDLVAISKGRYPCLPAVDLMPLSGTSAGVHGAYEFSVASCRLSRAAMYLGCLEPLWSRDWSTGSDPGRCASFVVRVPGWLEKAFGSLNSVVLRC